MGGEEDSLYSNNSVCFSASTLLLVSIEGLGFITSTGLACSFALVLTITFSCLSIFSFFSFCFSLIFPRKTEILSPREEPEESNNSWDLFIRAAQDTSRESVNPNKRDEMNKRRLPIKLRGTINKDDIFEPINPPPS